MKKTRKVLVSLSVAGMALMMVPLNAFAESTVPTRLSGNTAAQTAVAIANQTGWTGTAILASSAPYGMVDALTSGPLASYLNAPILLQEPGAVLNADTKAELIKLAVKTVYVTSGTSVISQAVLDQLKGMGIRVAPLGGFDRAATSVNIAQKMVGITKVAVANSNQDALSIAAIASAASEPILLTDKDTIPDSVKAFLAANPDITTSDVIGGTGVISDTVKAELPNATRHWGNTAYDTNSQVIQDFASSLAFDNIYVASGATGIDALAGASLASITKSPIILTDGKSVPSVAAFTAGKASANTVVTALGGEAVVPETIRMNISNVHPTPVVYTAPDYTYTLSDGKAQIRSYTGAEGVVTIPSTLNGIPVSTISFRSFAGHKGLTNINIPQGVSRIESNAFADCTGLTNINIPQGVTFINYAAFSGCTGLTSITAIDNPNYTSIGGVLYNKAVTTLQECPIGLKEISIPESVTHIYPYAFQGCTGLTSINLPEGLTTIYEEAFTGCTSLNTITIPQGVTLIGEGTFSGCIGLTTIKIPQGITSIYTNAFRGCTGLTAISLPQELVGIAGAAFYGCANLTSISIPQGVTYISCRAFEGCTGLTTISIPLGVRSIDTYAFAGCTGLTTIKFNSATTIIETTLDEYANTIPVATKIIGHDPSTAKDYATRYHRTFELIDATNTL